MEIMINKGTKQKWKGGDETTIYFVTVRVGERLAYFASLLVSNAKSHTPQFNQQVHKSSNSNRRHGVRNYFANLIPTIWRSRCNSQCF